MRPGGVDTSKHSCFARGGTPFVFAELMGGRGGGWNSLSPVPPQALFTLGDA